MKILRTPNVARIWRWKVRWVDRDEQFHATTVCAINARQALKRAGVPPNAPLVGFVRLPP